jgi:hypothetical protein
MSGVGVSVSEGVRRVPPRAYTNLVAQCSGVVLPCLTVITSDLA